MQVFFDLGVGLAFSPSHLQTTPMLGLADVEDVDVKQLSVSELWDYFFYKNLNEITYVLIRCRAI